MIGWLEFGLRRKASVASFNAATTKGWFDSEYSKIFKLRTYTVKAPAKRLDCVTDLHLLSFGISPRGNYLESDQYSSPKRTNQTAVH